MIYLTPNTIIQINQQVIKNANTKYMGIQYRQGLELVIEQPQMVIFGKELYPTIWLKAAFILQKVTKKHIFSDGNKRTAYISTKLFLMQNKYHLKLSTAEIIALMLSATKKADTEDEMIKISNFLKKHSTKIN